MKTLSIVIPVFNEAKRLQKTFHELQQLRFPTGLKLQAIIFVNDGSTDKTLSKIKTFSKNSTLPISILSYTTNKGKGYAVRKGMLASKSDYTLLCDADMSTPLSEIAKITSDMKNGADIIIGTRKNGKSTVIIHQPVLREVLGKGFTLITQIILNLKVTDFTCGFKMLSRNAIQNIFPTSKIDRWGYDAEILYLANKKGFSIMERPVVWSDDKGSHVNVALAIPQTLFELSKIRFHHSVKPHVALFSPFHSSFYVKAGKLISGLA